MTDQAISYGPYIRTFVLYFVGLGVLITAVGVYTDINLPSSTNLIVNFAAAMAAGTKFTKDMVRAPHKQERRKLALYFLLVVVVLSLLFLIGIFNFMNPDEVFPGISEIPPGAAIIIAAVIGVIYYGMSILGIKLGVKSELKRQERLPDDKDI